MSKYRLILSLLVLIFVGSEVLSEEGPPLKTLGPAGPPLSYKIQDVTIQLVHNAGYGPGGGYSIHVHGDGTGHYWFSQPPSLPEEWDFSLSRPAVVDLLNAFYKARFFDLSPSYAQQFGVAVSEDGTVTTTETVTADAGSTRITIKIGSYERTVSWSLNAPSELGTLELKIAETRRNARVEKKK